MATYDTIATQYQTSKQLPFRSHSEEYSLFQLMADLPGKSVLDLACGEGIYSRKLRNKGASIVVGVDISAEMIQLAKNQEQEKPLGIHYLVRDVAELEKIAEFDIVLGSFLLNYAQTKEQLTQFCQSIYKNLKPKGRFVGFNDNPANDPAFYSTYRKYGFIKSSPPNRSQGDPIRYTIINPDQTEFEFNNYYLSPQTYEEVFQEVGFRTFKWHTPLISESGMTQYGQDYWKEFIEQPPFIGLEAIK